MRRADRLFRLVQLLRGRRLTTAAWLAAKLEVSPRTVYRDVADLQAQALVASVRLAQSRLDRPLAIAAEEALGKIVAVLPPAARVAAETLPLYAPALPRVAAVADRLGLLREAVSMRRRIRFDYEDASGAPSTRTARPLGCFHWEAVWTLGAWCEQRADFRSFRIDRMRTLDVLDDVFRDEAGRTLPDFLRHVKNRPRLSTAQDMSAPQVGEEPLGGH